MSTDKTSVTFNSGRGGHPKVVLIPLAIDETFRTDGTSNAVTKIIDRPELLRLGPSISRVRVHWLVEGATNNFAGKVTISGSVAARAWTNPASVYGPMTGNAQDTGNWYTTDTSWGIHTRVAIDVSNAAGTAMENGRVTAYLEVELKS